MGQITRNELAPVLTAELDTFDTTGENTSLDTKNVNGVPATTITQKITQAETDITTLKEVDTTITEKVNAVSTVANGAKDVSNALALQIQNGGRLGDYCQTIYDWDAAKTNGFYMGANVANAPTTEWFIGHVTAHNDIWCEQRVVAFSTSKHEYIRYLFSGSWTGWQRVTLGNLDALQFGSKTDIATSLNELFQYADNGKNLVRNAVIGKGTSVVSNPTFEQLAAGVNAIKTPTIKKIIHLEVAIPASDRTITVPFETIDPKNSFVILNSYKYSAQKRHFTVFDSLFSDSIVVRKGGTVLASTARVTIVECNELKSYQMGISTKASDTSGFTEITINPVNLNKSICLLNFTGTSDNSMYNNDYIKFKDSTTIQINGQAGSYATAEWQWQVIEFM